MPRTALDPNGDISNVEILQSGKKKSEYERYGLLVCSDTVVVTRTQQNAMAGYQEGIVLTGNRRNTAV